ncbi:3-hydroxyacyl-CoA dehydrogenase/enoyl-CoA hydratase family protein [Varunaivibrio sulfuroxidans]|uniref:3-hydroxyacyl-CoA dehydrogenase n=1 Tax=Varunaivibrio sulfuroxidans TaxID=1773489 RepID=A0A4R3J6M6_9PROT|nr:3-hydroxyacyl-CoA dehydrogenase/enoyl-CoA hydratase family protein [Varunaivibrio sulfuroxidans]TCS60995.1 3-hydroxyacyl-CoA dehydrogenase [Varunaivibrio sulfuroxidans]WES31599.1 3-hydroxyacyl-CoA dehydrogenase NAD-binding domain-containing protein [Varunaivibrio sulfuroxidans]
MAEIEKIAVIGAGVMGAAIAAHGANAGALVVLLDVVPGAARKAIDRLAKTDPAPLMSKRFAARITPGSIEDDFDLLADCDWIIEAVIEDAAIKRDLYARIETVRKPGAIVSSNTSTLPLAVLCEGLPPSFRQRFLITHFFNPPRYMRLLEIVKGADTAQEAINTVVNFADQKMGKSVIACRDTPGFIANRIGTYWLHCAVTEAIAQGIDVETADALIGRPMGIPKTGVFGLLDLVGLDLMPHVLGSLENALPSDDAFHALGKAPDILSRMIDDGYTGRKGKGGFYRLNAKREKEVIDLATGAYGPAQRPVPAAVKAAKAKKGKGALRAMMSHDSPEGRYAFSVIGKTLSYAAALIGEIGDDIDAVDRAMRLGYNWKYGPFELIDRLGAHWLAQRLSAPPSFLSAVGEGRFYRVSAGRLHRFDGSGYIAVTRPAGVLLLEDVKRRTRPLATNGSASLWDIGDGALCLEFHSKMNTINPLTLAMIARVVKIGPRALVIYNEGANFSVGANIGLFHYAGKFGLWPFVRWMVKRGQRVYRALKHAPFPVVAAPSGMALGGGCEIVLHCDAIQAHSETYIGLVEAGVGIVPGWGGCVEMLSRWAVRENAPRGPMPPVMKAFELIATATVAKSAEQAREAGFLRPTDGATMNRDRVLFDAKQRALKMVEGYMPPAPQPLVLPGPTGKAALVLAIHDFVKRGLATAHDETVALQLARVLSGGDCDMTEPLEADRVLDLERDALLRLAHTPQTRARIAHILKTGKPLRN